jgi:hypothetical protein
MKSCMSNVRASADTTAGCRTDAQFSHRWALARWGCHGDQDCVRHVAPAACANVTEHAVAGSSRVGRLHSSCHVLSGFAKAFAVRRRVCKLRCTYQFTVGIFSCSRQEGSRPCPSALRASLLTSSNGNVRSIPAFSLSSASWFTLL